ncbi:MAG: hypothetical protein OCC49_16050, partial [Fibrobacterales bacterium]
SLVDDSVVEELVPESSVESIEDLEEPVELDDTEMIELTSLSADKPIDTHESESEDEVTSSNQFFNVLGDESLGGIDESLLESIDSVEVDEDLGELIEEQEHENNSVLDDDTTVDEQIDMASIEESEDVFDDTEGNAHSTFFTVTGDSSNDGELDLKVLDGIESVEVIEDLNEIVEESDLDDESNNLEEVSADNGESTTDIDKIEEEQRSEEEITEILPDEVLDLEEAEMIDLAALSESINEEQELLIDKETASIIDTSIDLSELEDDDTSALDELRIQEVEEEQKQQKAAEVPNAIDDIDYFSSIDPSELPTPTVTLAEIYFDQNLYAQALEMYRQLSESDTANEVLTLRMKEIKEILTKKAEN